MVVASSGMMFAAIRCFSSAVELIVRHSSDLTSEIALGMFTSTERSASPLPRPSGPGEPSDSPDEGDPRFGTNGAASAENRVEAASTGASFFEHLPPFFAGAGADKFMTNSTGGFSSDWVGVCLDFEAVAAATPRGVPPVSVLLEDELSGAERSEEAVGFVAAAGGAGCSRSLADEASAFGTLAGTAETDWVEEVSEGNSDESAPSSIRSTHVLCTRSCSGADVVAGVRAGGEDCWAEVAAGRAAEPEGESAAALEDGGGCERADSDAVVVVAAAAAAGGGLLDGAVSASEPEPGFVSCFEEPTPDEPEARVVRVVPRVARIDSSV